VDVTRAGARASAELLGSDEEVTMDYAVFEARVMELLYKTDAKLTPQLVSFRVGCSVEVARQHLERMAATDVLTMEPDESGTLYYDVAGRPPPTNEPLSWMQQQLGIAVSQPPAVVVVTGQPKSVSVAVMLALLFGPLGMLYSTGFGALVMFLVNLALVIPTFGLALLGTVPVCAIWAGHAASEHNRRVQVLPFAQAHLLPPPR
jgi:hypothetical protein